jgi:hypothetical protein
VKIETETEIAHNEMEIVRIITRRGSKGWWLAWVLAGQVYAGVLIFQREAGL